MYAPKTNLWPLILWNSLITAAIFILVGFAFYGPTAFGTYPQILQTLLFSVAYACLYTRASFNWRVNPNAGFLNSPWMISSAATSSFPWLRVGNSLIFSLLAFVVIMMSIYLAGILIINLYVLVLEGIRGAAPPPDSRGTGVTLVQIGLAGLGMEWVGKTEDQPRN